MVLFCPKTISRPLFRFLRLVCAQSASHGTRRIVPIGEGAVKVSCYPCALKHSNNHLICKPFRLNPEVEGCVHLLQMSLFCLSMSILCSVLYSNLSYGNLKLDTFVKLENWFCGMGGRWCCSATSCIAYLQGPHGQMLSRPHARGSEYAEYKIIGLLREG